MTIFNEITDAWLKHRFGETVDEKQLAIYVTKAIELNRRPRLIDTKGNRVIRGYVGFVDLVGFSEMVHNRSPDAVAFFVLPFLDKLADLVTRNFGLVDKSIGDEIMFIVPDFEEDKTPPSLVKLMTLLLDLSSYAQTEHYRFRISLSFGELFLGRVQCRGYSEWTFFGETIHVAKRLASDELVNQVATVKLICGVLEASPLQSEYDNLVRWIETYRRAWKKVASENKEYKGVGKLRLTLFEPMQSS